MTSVTALADLPSRVNMGSRIRWQKRHHSVSVIVPGAYGAWGILLVPLVTGACVGVLAGGSVESLAPLTVATLALFWLHTPFESWMGSAVHLRTPGETAFARNAASVLARVAAGALPWLFWGGGIGGCARVVPAAIRFGHRELVADPIANLSCAHIYPNTRQVRGESARRHAWMPSTIAKIAGSRARCSHKPGGTVAVPR